MKITRKCVESNLEPSEEILIPTPNHNAQQNSQH